MRSLRAITLLLVCALVAPLLSACAIERTTAMPTPGPRLAQPAEIRIGTLRTEDALPLWAAEQGIYDKLGVKVTVVSYDSAIERDNAFRAGQIDGLVSDVFTVARLTEGGAPNRVITICLGVTPSQGRHGIVVAPGSKVRQLGQLADVPIAVSAGGLEEYTLDGLTSSRPWVVKHTYVEDPYARYKLLMAKRVGAALLGEPYLSLAVRRGARLIADDTKSPAVLNQTVLSLSDTFLDRPEGAAAANRLLGAWDTAASAINAKRSRFRPLLAEKAKLPPALRLHYRMNSYPHHRLPTRAQVVDQLQWLRDRKLLDTPLSYAAITWTP